MKTVSCWFPALRECEGLGFIPPSQATEERGCFGVAAGPGGERRGKNECGEGGIRGSPLPPPLQTLGFPFPVGLGMVK